MTPAIWARPDFFHHPSLPDYLFLGCILLLPTLLGWGWEPLPAQGLKSKLMLEVWVFDQPCLFQAKSAEILFNGLTGEF